MTIEEGGGTAISTTTGFHSSQSLSQRPFRIRKSLKELVHKQRSIPKSSSLKSISKEHLTLPPLPHHDTKCDEFAYDVLYECQRGSLAVGYSSKTLLQFDPNPWCDANMRFTPMNIENYQLPDPTWEWVSKDWMIDMTEDVDEAGWQYALKFHGAVWHGNYKHFRSFVRRRRWIRLRHRPLVSKKKVSEEQKSSEVKTRTLVSVDEEEAEASTSHTEYKEHELVDMLKKCRLDRERMSVLHNAMKSTLPGLEDPLLQRANEYMKLFDYEKTKYRFLYQLLVRKYDASTQSFQLTHQEKLAIQSLRFYYDVQSILNKIDSSGSSSAAISSSLLV